VRNSVNSSISISYQVFAAGADRLIRPVGLTLLEPHVCSTDRGVGSRS